MHRLRTAALPGFAMLVACLVLAAGCTGGTREVPSSTPTAVIEATPTATPIFTATATPIATATSVPTAIATPTLPPGGTGVPSVDAVIEAVRRRDAQAFLDLLRFYPVGCTRPDGIGAIPCPAGAPLGTPVQVSGSGGCEGSFFGAGSAEAHQVAAAFIDVPRPLYAVIDGPPFAREPEIPGEYQVIFHGFGPNVSASAVSVDREGITYVRFGCMQTVEGFAGAAPRYLVPPVR